MTLFLVMQMRFEKKEARQAEAEFNYD